MPEKKTTAASKATAPTKSASTAKKAEPVKKATPAKTTGTTKSSAPVQDKAAPKSTATKPVATASKTKPTGTVEKNTTAKETKTSTTAVKKKTPSKGNNTHMNKLIPIFTLVGFVLLIGIVIAIVLSTRSCSFTSSGDVYENTYKTSTRVDYETEYLGTVKRNPPSDTSNEGLPAYPTYGRSLGSVLGTSDEAKEKRNAIIKESWNLASTTTRIGSDGYPKNTYDRMDKDGNLYLGNWETPSGPNTPDKLYKHSSSVGMYQGDVSDDEPGVIKRITMGPLNTASAARGYGITGLYAPAGEVIKLEISQEDMDATGGITVYIGQALFNGKANNIWLAKNAMNRFPVILNTLVINKSTAILDEETGIYTAYIGSFLGGPIYIVNEKVTFTTTISGAVNYSHFILGYTSEEEFNKNKQSTAPYFDLEVWEYGVLHSGPKVYADRFNYEQIYDAAVYWDKVSLVSTQRSKQGIVFLYDPFVAAGAAVAFPGQGSVNCPTGWMTGSLNYEGLVKSGSWGNMHEYNHNFQGYGCGDDGEVTNNALNIVEYSLFTKISANRQIGSYGGAGLGGWNSYTSATWALQRVNQNQITSTNGLAVYATLMHNLGQDAFMKSSSGRGVNYFLNWGKVTHQDMSYYAGLTNTFSSGNSYKDALHEAQKDYPMFVPVSSVYQTGRSYNYDGEKRYIETQQPFVINYGSEYDVDLSPYVVEDGQYASGSVVMPEGFSYTIKSVNTKDVNGKFEKKSDFIYTFKPNDELRSGKIYVTLEITKDDGEFEVDDVDLVLEFEQTHERTKLILERTTYTYEEGNAYTSAVEAFNNNYAGYKEKKEADNINFTQNSNTDIWYAGKGNTQYPDHIVPDNSVVEVKGKLFFEDAGKYRIYLRGRKNCALYISKDGGETFELGGKIEDVTAPKNSAAFRLNDANTYIDVEVEDESWIYYKTVLITQMNDTTVPYIGIGVGEWETPTYTIQTTTDANGNEITKYYNTAGKEVSAEEANNTDLIPPTTASYATAYRNTYKPNKDKFETEYFYTRTYTYNYNDNVEYKDAAAIVSSNYVPWANTDEYKLDNLVDGDAKTYIHTGKSHLVSEQAPYEFVIDLGKEVTANQMTILTRTNNPQYPVNFKLEGSLDGQSYFNIGTYENMKMTGSSVIAAFEKTTFRYYRLTITKSSDAHIYMSEIQFAKVFELNNGKKITLDSKEATMKGTWESKSMLSTLGHVYEGKKNSKVELEFEGTRLGVLVPNANLSSFEVYIDGKKLDTIELKKAETGLYMAYISPELAEGKHKVSIVCKGTTQIDSIVCW